eukprot:CAMPEP_0185029090 /NCGR_PEP_ID=MMETSP1103-20130426/15190_1 /TAXON_ID=36769 /ORGANISM="Paraphysomonas bandaiensis, Strain Caron Lab Isolate" /LENGTH=504 /DNA_ID=CAMNT_0027563707 /DNA_START=1 /DNA_END=1512 /DNA_ORIENTATION=-
MSYLTLYTSFALPLLAAAQSYGNITYDPLTIVRGVHNVPHLDRNLQPSSKDFDIDLDISGNTYEESVLVLPILFTCILFLGFTMFELCLCCRMCCKTCRCLEDQGAPLRNTITTLSKWNAAVASSRGSLIRQFFAFAILTLIACQGMLWCSHYYVQGASRSVDAVDALKDTSVNLENSGDYLENSGDIIISLVTDSLPSCPEASDILEYTDDYEQYIEDYNDIIEPIPGDLDDLEAFMRKYGVVYVRRAVWFVYGAFLAFVVAFLCVYTTKSKTLMRIIIAVGLILLHVLLILWCLFAITMIVLADFCMAPTDNMISVCPGSAETVAEYYGTCNGTNPFDDSLDSAYDAMDSITEGLDYLTQSGGPCEGNPYLLQCYPNVDDINGNLTFIEGEISCEPMQRQWAKLFNDSVCDGYFTAVFITFFTLLLIILCLFSLLIVASLLYQYFGELWEVSDESMVEITSTESNDNPVWNSTSTRSNDLKTSDLIFAEPDAPPIASEHDTW